MSEPKIIVRTQEDLVEERSELLAKAGKTAEELRRLHDAGSLSGAEWSYWLTLSGIDWLLYGVDSPQPKPPSTESGTD
jgi:hypothetical protein